MSGWPRLPAYGAASLAELLPSVVAALGAPGYPDVLCLGRVTGGVRAVVVVLVDGLGAAMLEARQGHAPYLRALSAAPADGVPAVLTASFPTTTATSLGTFGVGVPPGQHGLVGYEVLDPDLDRVVNQLQWPKDLDPVLWQPLPTIFETAQSAGIRVVRTGPMAFDGSGLTAAALRGGEYAAAETLADRVDAALAACRPASGDLPVLVYLYWGELDRTGHDRGWQSLAWTRQLEDLDIQLGRLSRSSPPGTAIIVTADHGMVDVGRDDRVDLAGRPDLTRSLRHVAGEPRAVYLWPTPGRTAEVVERWAEALDGTADVVPRERAAAEGWFGPSPETRALARAGEVIVLVRRPFVVLDSSRHRPDVLRLVGWHGSLTDDEVLVPLLLDVR
jgi:hypothetical protein